MNSQKTQKEAVYNIVIKHSNPETKVYCRAEVIKELTSGLLSGEIRFSTPKMLESQSYLRNYVNGLLSNWNKKHPLLVGYTPDEMPVAVVPMAKVVKIESNPKKKKKKATKAFIREPFDLVQDNQVPF